MDYKRTNWIRINEELGHYRWEEINENTDLNQYAEHFKEKFLSIIEKNTPTKIISVRAEDKRWMCKEIRKIMRKRNVAYKKAKGKP